MFPRRSSTGASARTALTSQYGRGADPEFVDDSVRHAGRDACVCGVHVWRIRGPHTRRSRTYPADERSRQRWVWATVFTAGERYS